MKQIKNKPLISVIMPVYNTKAFASYAIESILGQSYRDFEFIIIDDGSTDGSYKILERFAKKDKRIRLFRNDKKLGISTTMRKAIGLAHGSYLARMDADDIALPKRLEKQLFYLQKHSGTVAIGGQCLLIDENNDVIGEKTFPTSFENIYKYSFQFVPVQQPTLMIARKRLPKNFTYYEDGLNTAEEVELFFKLFTHGKVENLSDYVLLYRFHDHNTSFANLKQTFFLTLLSRIKAVYKYGYVPTLSGIAVTVIQALLVLLLPKKAVMLLYKSRRHLRSIKFATRKDRILENVQLA